MDLFHGKLVSLLFCNTNKPSNPLRYVQKVNVDKILKSILKRQIPFLIGGTITGTIMTYYYGFLFTIIVNSAIWYGISYVVNKYYWKSAGLKDQKYLLRYTLSKISSRKKKSAAGMTLKEENEGRMQG
jgi:ABC-type transport system involved in Fe-S cluster assembly fused permease/ATPase subunit